MMTKKVQVQVNPLNKKNLKLKIQGVTSLLMNKMSPETIELMKSYFEGRKKKQEKKQVTKEQIAEAKIYRNQKGNVVFKSAGFTQGMMDVAPKMGGVYKNQIPGIKALDTFVEIKHKKQLINEDTGRTTTGTPIPCIRPEFTDWSCELLLQYDANMFSPADIINLLNYAGFYQGLGDNRPGSPKKPGSHGQYQVVN